jgi:nicotinamidase-related amidase
MLLQANDCQLVLIDYQPKLMPAIAGGAEVVQRAAMLAAVAQLLQVPVWGTEQAPQQLGELLPSLRAHCRQVYAKTSFDASAGELLSALPPSPARGANARSLPRHLQKPAAPARQTVILAGCEAHVCVLQTALSLLEHELDVCVVTDACGSRRDRDRDAAFDRMAANGVELLTAEMVAFEWLRDAKHPRFREALALIK